MSQNILLFVGLLVCLSATICLSQKIIPQAGLTLARTTLGESSFSSTPSSEKDAVNFRLGFTAGVGAEFPLSTNVHFQSGINFIQKGLHSSFKGTFSGVQITNSDDYKLNYLEAPFHLRIVLPSRSNKELYIKAGPGVAYFVNGNVKGKQTVLQPGGNVIHGSSDKKVIYNDHKSPFSPDVEYLENRVDAVIYVGLGMKVTKRLNIDVGFSHGLISNDYWWVKSSNSQVLQFVLSTPIDMFPGRNILKDGSSN